MVNELDYQTKAYEKLFNNLLTAYQEHRIDEAHELKT